MRKHRSFLFLLLAMLPLAALAGCHGEDEKIESYTVEQPNREPMRMLTAMVPTPKAYYFVKLQGPEGAVADQKKAFEDFIASLKVNALDLNAPLTWKAPAGWKEHQGGGGMRLATFRIDGARPIEVAITFLGAADDLDKAILDNVNRWRLMVNLPLAEPANVDQLVKRTKIDGQEIIVADMTGTGVYQPPVAIQAAQANPHAGLPMFGGAKLAKAKLPFRFTPPPGWQILRPLPMFAVEAYQLVEGKNQATLSITSVGGSLHMNVKRWRTDQLGLPEVPADEVDRSLRPIRMAGKEAKYIDLVNPRLDRPNNRILGVILPGPDTNWVIKMTGPDELVGRQKAVFEAFVESFQPAAE